MTADTRAEFGRRNRAPEGVADSVRRWRAVLSAGMLLVLLIGFAAAAWAQSTPRAAGHDTFGRMVFDWDGPVKFSAETVNSQLIVRFDKPIAGDPKVVLKPLAKYLKGVTLSPDRKMATFPLAVPVQVKSFQTGNSVVVDLSEAKASSSSSPPPPPAVHCHAGSRTTRPACATACCLIRSAVTQA